MFKILFFFFLLIVQVFTESYQPPICFAPCPANEEFGQKKCNKCEPTCDNTNPTKCTKRFCPCSCDCKPGLFRNTKTKKCVKKCPKKEN
ncbi:hypothetical protein niasHT_032565 [Heterodera trifolii]|uniref:TIL domain-containing protein n=1 Tax=Heterodera trifolii TaxID=157864 RepID=A0ABD2J7G9_9BILA